MEYVITLKSIDKHGRVLRETGGTFHSNYAMLQFLVSRCVCYAREPDAYELVFTDRKGTEQTCKADFFRKGSF